MPTDAERYAFLKALSPNMFIITRGDNATNYETVEQWLADNDERQWADVIEGERDKITSTKTLWTLQVYPETPIGFFAWAASSLDVLIDKAIGEFGEYAKR